MFQLKNINEFDIIDDGKHWYKVAKFMCCFAFTCLKHEHWFLITNSYQIRLFITLMALHCTEHDTVRIRRFSGTHFPHSDWIQRYTQYLSVFSPNTEKYGPEKLRIRTLFTQYGLCIIIGFGKKQCLNYKMHGSRRSIIVLGPELIIIQTFWIFTLEEPTY